ncbi:DUF664 domain-containing protein [Streptomyces sp. SM10]|uniref:mycothiol transferase n=1 Tax=Streptomyces sp. SM10 TaxID=565556 RepID=UPI0027E4D08B|nr:DUF664 domain-containing protein [Streptomyces sp. SM10]
MVREDRRSRHLRGAEGPDVRGRQLGRPSGWSGLGLTRHLALDVEPFWFRAVVAGDRDVIGGLGDCEDAWQVGPDVPATGVLAGYRREAELADAIITATSADTLLAW